jgi:MoaA/NifB/PqqE/SkfB family radical SAM enzyme
MKIDVKKITKVGKNTVLGSKNLLLRNIKGFLKPQGLVFMVTDKCNSRCTHSSIWRQKGVDNPLTPKELEKTLSDPLFKDIREIINTGGEATLRTDLE